MGNTCFGRPSVPILKPFDEKEKGKGKGKDSPRGHEPTPVPAPKAPTIVVTEPNKLSPLHDPEPHGKPGPSDPVKHPEPAHPKPAPHAEPPKQAPHAEPPKQTPHPEPHPPKQEPPHQPPVRPDLVPVPVPVPAEPAVQPSVPAPGRTPSVSDEPSEEDLQVVKEKKRMLEHIFASDPIRGYIDKDRLRSVLEKMKINDRDIHEYLWKRYDSDYNGKVDFEEFCTMVFEIMDMKKTFEAADRDNSQSISKDEIGTVLARMDISLSPHTISLLMDLFDKDHNGVVDFSEFFPLSVYLRELVYEHECYRTRPANDTKFLRPLLGLHPDKEEEVAKELRKFVSDNNFPTLDEFVRVIVTAANEKDALDFSKVKAPQILKVRPRKAQSSYKPKVAISPVSTSEAAQKRRDVEGLYEDPDFPANNSILPAKAKDIVWKRPSEINKEKHELFVNGVEEGDVIQGSLGDCWFLGALAVVAASGTEFIKDMFVDSRPQQGYYCCRFFKDGQWEHVEVDDRLPCRYSKSGESYHLYFASCKDEGEFWVPLVEKAYAKLHGSYGALEGGNICDALKDLTGGAIEILTWKEEEKHSMWNKIRSLSKQRSLMGCSIDSSAAAESRLTCGLLVNHAYSILKCKEVDGIKFVRVRNPWGEGEWTGDWSDKSELWTDEWKAKKFVRQYTWADDGTFFMTFEDFIRYFNRIYVMRSGFHEAKWTTQGEWKKGRTASGCKNNPYWLSNPQYGIVTFEPDTPIFINLSQPDLRYKLKKSPEDYKSDSSYESVGLYILKSGSGGDKYKKTVYCEDDRAGSSRFTDMRDISFEYVCPKPDTYILLPCTFHADREANFMISLYSDKRVDVIELAEKKSATIKSRWVMGSTAGGCSNYRSTTWMSNPQFLFQNSQTESIDILLAQPSSKNIAPIGIYLFAAMDEGRLVKPARALAKPTDGMPEEASVSITFKVDANENYIIMPATLDPVDSEFSLTIVSENLTTFREL